MLKQLEFIGHGECVDAVAKLLPSSPYLIEIWPDIAFTIIFGMKNGEIFRGETALHREVFRPWGSYDSIDMADNFQVKRLIVKPGAVLSLQKHAHRSEHWVCVKGRALITRNDEEFTLNVNESTYVAIGDVHRIANPYDEPVHIIEVQCGEYLGEDDIVRFEDVYDRCQEN